ncbi:MAG: LemA family protein, LemA protein [Candidatus Gottesmanbacteria bacterium GW2011_GWA2_43_14]|uniref:LemA family protein, LemA protein n=1 Tax=Candidatus Gottesmanbacteria bacterium GW2011_GWA2_43_14 TaxID=1618443 RepID=A0A0G1DLR9_9BACT|nr:MAG: LemA family protein, LemA protein [Candidatus Gottesmanbacteria bacterium GW2011_GWA2_43_14]
MLFALAAILGLVALYIWFIYNDLVSSRMKVIEAWSQIDVQLKRRADLIPNLVETVKGYAKHEKKLLENVTKARTALLSASGPKEKAVADNQLSGVLKSLFAVAENYPTLKANENFLHLQKELSDTEDKVTFSRQHHNTMVMEYNTKLQMFPNSLIAERFNFRDKEFYEAEEADKKKVEVKFEE